MAYLSLEMTRETGLVPYHPPSDPSLTHGECAVALDRNFGVIMTTHFYLKPGIPVSHQTVQEGKSTYRKGFAKIGRAEMEIRHDARGLFFLSSDFSYGKNPCDGDIASELAEATAHLTYSNNLPTGCLREVGTYCLEGASARVTEEGQPSGSKYNSVFVTAPNFKSLQAMWQALLDGTIRPERPLFNKPQQGLSYNELSATVAKMTPELRQAMLRLGEAESVITHLNAVVKSCGDVIAQQRHAMDRAKAERDDAKRQLMQTEDELLDRKDRAGELR